MEIKGSISSVSLLFTSRSLDLEIEIAFLIPALMTSVGYSLFVIRSSVLVVTRREKTGLRGFRTGPTQTGLYKLRKELEA